MEIPRIYIFQNPVAGSSDPDQIKAALTSILEERGIEFRIHQTGPQEDIPQLASQAAAQGYRWIWAVGGDGTVSEVANGLVGSQSVLGIIPVGSGNSLARELGIPLNAEKACAALLDQPRTRRIDAILIKGTHYFLWVSAGVGAKTMRATNRSEKRALGRLAYFINGLRIYFNQALWPFQIEIDGQAQRSRATEVIAANAGIIGYRALRWGQDIRVDDGEINLCHVRADTLGRVLNALRGAALEQQDQVVELSCQPARKEIRINLPRGLVVQGDGEVIGTTPVSMEVVPDAIKILTCEEGSLD